jgi:hypothetical protein
MRTENTKTLNAGCTLRTKARNAKTRKQMPSISSQTEPVVNTKVPIKIAANEAATPPRRLPDTNLPSKNKQPIVRTATIASRN